MSTMSPKILIIGGGISGLALAQCLRRAAIDFEIFERDATEYARGQGWAITLRECLAGIYKMFPDDMPDLEESVSVFRNLDSESADLAGLLSHGQKVAAGGVNASTGGQIAELEASGKEDMKHHWIRANRADFRKWLAHGLNIQWGKHFLRYEETAGKVRAVFADGSTAEGDLLVGADGAHSHVRTQLLGPERSQLKLASMGVISANILVNPSEYQDLLRKGAAFINAASPTYHYFLAPCIFNGSDPAEYYYALTWDHKAEDIMKAYSHDMDGASQKQLALELTNDLHPSLRRYIENTNPEQIVKAGFNLLAWAPDEDRLPGKRVTVAGDGLHTMPPFRGAGANTAILDALDIAQLLIQARNSGRDVADIVDPYERMACPRGRSTMQFSVSAGLSPDPLHWSRTMKAVFDAGYEWKELDKIL